MAFAIGTRWWVLLCVPLLLLGAEIHAQPTQRELAEQLRAEDPQARGKAVEFAARLNPSEIGPGLRAALVAALGREAEAYHRRESRARRGEPIEDLGDPYLLQRLSRTVARLRAPEAIPVMVEALGADIELIRALAELGEDAAVAVLDLVMGHDPSEFALPHGLIVLRCMAEGSAVEGFSSETRGRILAAAAYRLAEPGRLAGSGVTLGRAIDLAGALETPELAEILVILSQDANEVFKRGVQDPARVEAIQIRARRALMGAPAPGPTC